MHEDGGVWMARSSNHMTILIPKYNTELINWVMERWNVHRPMKRLQRINSWWLEEAASEPSTYFRTEFARSEESKKLFFK